MNRLVKTVLLAGAAWGALSASAVAQEASTEAQVSSIDDVVVFPCVPHTNLERRSLVSSPTASG